MDELAEDIIKILEKIEYGDVNFQVKTTQGKPSVLVTFSHDQRRYKNNSDAGAAILEFLAVLAHNKANGAYTFTAQMKDGQIKEIVYERVNQKKYEIKKNGKR